MKITIDLSKLNFQGHGEKIMNDRAFWTFAATEWHKLYLLYVPVAEGNLGTQVVIRPKEIEHTAPYAHYQYEGIVYGPNYPISDGFNVTGYWSPPHKKPTGKRLKYKNAKASAKWDQAAAGTQFPKLIDSLQAYIDSGRIKLD